MRLKFFNFGSYILQRPQIPGGGLIEKWPQFLAQVHKPARL